MRCDATTIARLADGELGLFRQFWARRHIPRCIACAEQLEAMRAMRGALRSGLARYPAPQGLAARIAAALPREAPPAPQPARWWQGWQLQSGVGFGLGGAIAGVALTLLVQTGMEQEAHRTLAQLAVDAHTQASASHHEIEIADSDRHVVKPWLSQRIDVSPPVRDLRRDGFVLLGGRMDHLGARPAAVVVYRHDQHRIDLFAWAEPDGPDTPPARHSRQGFNILSWRSEGIGFLAVSDLEAAELAKFAAKILQAP